MLSLKRYATVLATPDLGSAIAASIVGRLPIGITGLSILMLAQAVNGSFTRGGALTAAYIAGLACAAPVIGRLIDRSGPRQILLFSSVAFPIALCALAYTIRHQGAASGALVFAMAFCAGASFPPITVCMRTFFRQRLGEDPLLSAAFSLESVLIEMIFIAGPLLVAILLVIGPPDLAVLVAAACGSSGTWLFLRSPVFRHWRLESGRATGWLGPLSAPGMVPLLGIVLGYASAFGLVEVAVVGHATARGTPAYSGVLLSLMSLGSAAGGLGYGSRVWRTPLRRQFAAALILMGAGIATLAVTSAGWLFAVLSLLAGLVMAPALTIQSMLVARTAPPAHLTEAFTWSSTGLLCGVGAGMAAGGWIVEVWGARAAFAVAALASVLSGLAALGLRARR